MPPDEFVITVRFVIGPFTYLFLESGDPFLEMYHFSKGIHGLFHHASGTMGIHFLGKIAH